MSDLFSQHEINMLLQGFSDEKETPDDEAVRILDAFGIKFQKEWFQSDYGKAFVFCGIAFGYSSPIDLLENTFFLSNIDNLNSLHEQSFADFENGLKAEKMFYRIMRQCGYNRVFKLV